MISVGVTNHIQERVDIARKAERDFLAKAAEAERQAEAHRITADIYRESAEEWEELLRLAHPVKNLSGGVIPVPGGDKVPDFDPDLMLMNGETPGQINGDAA